MEDSYQQFEIAIEILYSFPDRHLHEARYFYAYIVFVKFPPIKEITDAFSALCNVRVIWGGDMTVAELRQSKIPARTTEITFADRHSIAIIDAGFIGSSFATL